MWAAVLGTLRKVCTTLTGAVGLVIVLLVMGCALFAPWVATHNPDALDVMNRFSALRPYTPPADVLDIFRRELEVTSAEGGLLVLRLHPGIVGRRSQGRSSAREPCTAWAVPRDTPRRT